MNRVYMGLGAGQRHVRLVAREPDVRGHFQAAAVAMRSAAWRRVAGLFDSVVDLAPAEREARLREAAGSDGTLGREVRELVRASGRSGNGDFIAATVAATANEMTVGRTEKEASDPQRPSSSNRSDQAPSNLAASSGRPAAR